MVFEVNKLFVVGVSHQTAPVAIRESLAVGDAVLRERLLQAAAVCGEAVILSTCNRVEIYGSGPLSGSLEHAKEILLQKQNHAASCVYEKRAEQAVLHLFRVAASLDSLVVGEAQILGQLKQAFRAAQEAGTVGEVLGTLLPKAFFAAKRIRSETTIGENPASVASVAVQLAEKVFSGLKAQPVLVIGAGKMAECVVRHLLTAKVCPLWIVNRTFARAEHLAKTLGGEAQPFDQLETLLSRAAIVVSSTGAAHPILHKDLVSKVMRRRKGRWLFLMDIAVPRDIAPDVGDLDNVYLYDLDALQQVVSHGQHARALQTEAAHRIIDEELARLVRRTKSADVVPTIRALRARAHEIAASEVARVLPRFGPLTPSQQQLLEHLGKSIVNKLLHPPLVALHKEASDGNGQVDDLAEAVAKLWALDTQIPQTGESFETSRMDGKDSVPTTTSPEIENPSS